MNRARARRLAGFAVLLVALGLAWEGWNRVAPALDDGWLSPGMTARLFLPVLLLAAIAIWLVRR